jgi:hypothetical protein
MGSVRRRENNFRGNGTNNSNDNATDSNNVPSRLLSNTSSLRNNLVSRNLYTPYKMYPITEKSDIKNIVNAVGSIINLITPFKSYDLKNTVYGRLVTSQTPLTEIGLAMLGNQFALNMSSHIAQQTFPTIKVANLFDGARNTHLFTNNINFSITKKKAVTNFQEFIDSTFHMNPDRNNPFKTSKKTNVNSMPIEPYAQNKLYIENTGEGQLTFLYNAFNQNIYKKGFSTNPDDLALEKYAKIGKFVFTDRTSLIGDYSNPLNKFKNYFNFLKTNPYHKILTTDNSIINANGDIVYGLTIVQTQNTQEYAPNDVFIKENFGFSDAKQNRDFQEKISKVENSWINVHDEFDNNNIDYGNKLIWGRNGISEDANNNIGDLRGNYNSTKTELSADPGPNGNFNAYSGLLEYTRNLLNASNGNLIDITRKAFLKGKNVDGFNGSGLWVANKYAYAISSGINDKTGVRQHSVLDQYDRFAKAIRFNGNNVYNGNENSVIYNSVLPRIHPTLDKENKVDNKNLMLSIENLAIQVISNTDGNGIIDDEYGSMIPGCEVGPFNGRLMWFPPYNMKLNESTSAKFDSTVMVGRNEPMYSYMNSERSATLSFTLLVDYPQILKNQLYKGTGADKHRIISEFFAFGGDSYEGITPANNTAKKTQDTLIEIKKTTGPTKTAEPEVKSPVEYNIVFPNDFPKSGQEDDAIDIMYKAWQYQIDDGCLDASSKITIGLNKNIFVKTGVTGSTTVSSKDPNHKHLDVNILPIDFSQYTSSGITDCALNASLYDIYKTPVNREYYDILVLGGASKLYTEQNPNDTKEEQNYNQKLGKRRADAAIYLVRNRIKALFGDFPENMNPPIIIKYDTSAETYTGEAGTTGSKLADQDNAYKKKIEELDTINERYARIKITRKSKPTENIEPIISEQDKENIKLYQEDVQAITKVNNIQKNNSASNCVMNERDINSSAIMGGFESVSGNYYSPVFHSQTPEDFHRRLTFLQQCMRQGAAKKYNLVNDNGVLRAKNSAFGRQPICILRVGDFFYTKIIIENLTIDYSESTWDTNPEGFGMQPMIAEVTLQIKIIGGQSLKGPIDALQNAVTFNYYANSNFTDKGMYLRPSIEAENQKSYMKGILISQEKALTTAYNNKVIDDYIKLF